MATASMAAYPLPQAQFTTAEDFETSQDLQQLSDDALVAAAKMGVPDAFAQLIERHHRFCLSKAYSIVRNHSDAEDDVQSAWVKAWTHLDSYQGKGAFAAWLRRIVSNECLMRLRRATLTPMTSVDEVFDAEGAFHLEVIDQRSLPEQLVGEDEVMQVLIKEMRGVPPMLRKVLVMRSLQNMIPGDIAKDLGISVTAAKSRLMRARLELKKRMEKHCGEKGRATLTHKPFRRQAAFVRAS